MKDGTRTKTTIIAAAEKAMTPANRVNCSGYVRDVALSLGEYIPDVMANEMVEYLRTQHSWVQLGNDDVEASKLAGQNYLVIAGWVNPDKYGHGHVVIILPGRAGRFAKGSWGSLRGAAHSGENEGIDYAFTVHELPEVEYFATRVSALTSAP